MNDQPSPGRPPHAVTVALRVEPGWKMELSPLGRILYVGLKADFPREYE